MIRSSSEHATLLSPEFILGIDLGTSNSAVAIADLAGENSEIAQVSQILAPNQLGEKFTLPSALYIPHGQEFPENSVQAPWDREVKLPSVVGHFARDHGAMVPDRLVVSAKSWLSNPHIDPKKPVLPWKSNLEEGKLSPLECSRRYLETIREGVLHAERLKGREWDIQQGQVVLTVPASFDEVARNLTAEAATLAGLGQVILLEEPQAAFYAWIEQAGNAWRTQVSPGDIILVADLGGGTADFSLIAVSQKEGALELERISVGEHILLGGDNMDLALAYTLQARMEAEGKKLDSWQFLALIHAASKAKARLFEEESLEDLSLSIPTRGSSLFAKSLSVKLDRETLLQVVLEGFFPMVSVTDQPKVGVGTGLQEFGLPYASDPVVSKHLARFLTRSRTNVAASPNLSELVGGAAMKNSFITPTAILFNGGVFKAEPLRKRVRELLASWSGAKEIRELEGFQPDLAVAKGAAAYGRTRISGKGMRIKAGTARSYYIGLETSMPAVPGFIPPVKGLCVVPQGMEEGTELLLEEKEFGLVTGQPVQFRFFSTEVRSGDLPGEVVADALRELEETTPLEITLPALEGFAAGQVVPVRIHVVVTEVGTLELWMKHPGSGQKWKIEFHVRTE